MRYAGADTKTNISMYVSCESISVFSDCLCPADHQVSLQMPDINTLISKDTNPDLLFFFQANQMYLETM